MNFQTEHFLLISFGKVPSPTQKKPRDKVDIMVSVLSTIYHKRWEMMWENTDSAKKTWPK